MKLVCTAIKANLFREICPFYFDVICNVIQFASASGYATTVTLGDCNARDFTFVSKVFRLPARMNFGFTKPKINILGTELAGEIEAVGKDVILFTSAVQRST
jgi:hypothetical protein